MRIKAMAAVRRSPVAIINFIMEQLKSNLSNIHIMHTHVQWHTCLVKWHNRIHVGQPTV